METKFFPQREIIFTKHPEFDNVKIAMFITDENSDICRVYMIELAPGSETPIHTHEEHADSVFVVQGHGETYVNGSWRPIETGDYIFVPKNGKHGTRNTGSEPLRLFIHHGTTMML